MSVYACAFTRASFFIYLWESHTSKKETHGGFSSDKSLSHDVKPGGGEGTQIIFWRTVRPEVWNPYPYLRIFLTQKKKKKKKLAE